MASLSDYEVPKVVPFIKWAGGKSQLFYTFEAKKCFPEEFGAYFEPFLGGGAVFFYLVSMNRMRKAVISDSNKDLINCYVAIRDRLDELLVRLRGLQKHVRDKDFYYGRARPTFNSIKLESGQEGDTEKAALLLYLNKTCFNGLYRVNRKGEFNVPWGSYKNPRIYDEENLVAISRVLGFPDIRILCRDYESVQNDAKPRDFVYFDPPYLPLSKTANFTSYTSTEFGWNDQERLAHVFHNLSARRCYALLSNSPGVGLLYTNHGYRIEIVKAGRAINSVGSKRGPIDELLVMNY